MSAIIDPLDRTTAVLFGDGAGAVLLEPAEPGFGLLGFHHRVDGSGRNDLMMPAGGSFHPASARDGRRSASTISSRTGRRSSSSPSRRWPRASPPSSSGTSSLPTTSPWSSRTRPTSASSTRPRSGSGCPPGRMASVIGRYGNTTAATLPLALDDVLQEGRISRGDLVVFVAVGAGFTVGASLVRWQ